MDALSICFLAITLATVLLFYFATKKTKTVLIIYPIWALFIGVLTYLGFFLNTNTIPPRILLILVGATAYVLYFYRNISIENISINYLLAIHVLRIPVEMSLLALYENGKVPQMMTYEGLNFDIFSGISATILLIYNILGKKEIPSTLFRIWNYLCLVLLFIIVSIGILSAPSFLQRLSFEQPNVAVLIFPFSFLPAIVVPTVLLAHLFILKKINTLKK